jgi:hypothetical protein
MMATCVETSENSYNDGCLVQIGINIAMTIIKLSIKSSKHNIGSSCLAYLQDITSNTIPKITHGSNGA